MQKLHLTTAKPKFRPAHNEKRAFFRNTTSVSALDAYSVSITPPKFCFTEFEAIESNLPNIHLTGKSKLSTIHVLFLILMTIFAPNRRYKKKKVPYQYLHGENNWWW